MKPKGIFLTALSLFVSTLFLFSQVPNSINYQAVARDGSGNSLSNQGITVKMGVYEGAGGAVKVYEETHALSTNQFGLFTIQIGQGTPSFGLFASIDWASKENHLQVEVDAGNGFVNMGKTQFVSVPYAIHARTVEIDMVDDADSDPNNEIQTLSLSGSDLSISGGNTVALPGGGGGDITAVTAGAGLTGGGISGAVTLTALTGSALWNANELQGKAISVTSPANGQVLKWNGTVWHPANDFTGAVWSQNGNNAYYNTGSVGIGTTVPTASLQISAGAGVDPLRVQVAGSTKLMVHDNGGVGVGYGLSPTPANGLIVGGDVGIGTASPSHELHIIHGTFGATNTGDGLKIENGGANNNNWTFYTYNGSADLGVFFGTTLKGTFNDVTGAYAAASDRRFKKNIEPMKNVLSSVLTLSPKSYHFNENDDLDPKSSGFIAQEVMELFPEFVTGFGENENDLSYSIDYAGFSVVAIKAIQEQQEQIEALQKQVEDLIQIVKE